MSPRNLRSKQSGSRHKQETPIPAGADESEVVIDSKTHETIKDNQPELRRNDPIPSSKRAAKATRDLKLTLIVDAKILLKNKFSEKQRDHLLAILLKFRPTKVKHELEDCLDRLYIHINPQLVELLRIWRKGMIEQVYPNPSEAHHKTVDKQFQYFLKQFQTKLFERIDDLRNECLDFLNDTYGDIDSSSEESEPEDEPVLSPAAGPRPSVVLAFEKGYGPSPEDSDSDTEMTELPTRKYSVFPTIPGRLAPPKQTKKFGEGMFARPGAVRPRG